MVGTTTLLLCLAIAGGSVARIGAFATRLPPSTVVETHRRLQDSTNTSQGGAVIPPTTEAPNTTQSATVPPADTNSTQSATVSPDTNATLATAAPSAVPLSATVAPSTVPPTDTTNSSLSTSAPSAVPPSDSNTTQSATASPTADPSRFAGTLSLGNLRPEGIHALPNSVSESIGLGNGNFALVGSLMYGGVRAINLATGNLTVIVPSGGFMQRQIVGLQYWNNTILAAGGGRSNGAPNETGGIYVFDIKNGSLLHYCQAPLQPAFINDLTILGDQVYATNSIGANFMYVNLTTLVTENLCYISYVNLPDMLFSSPGKFYMNGIVSFGTGIMFCLTTPGSLWWIDRASSNITTVLETGTIVGCDGLTLANTTDGVLKLYVTENGKNRISVWTMTTGTDGFPVATPDGYLMNTAFDNPSTSAVVGDNIYSVNARFSLGNPAPGEDDLSTFNETFQLVTTSLSKVATLSPTEAPSVSPTMPMTISPTQSPVAPIPGAAGTFDLGPYRPEGIHILPPGVATRLGLPEGPYAMVSQFAFGGVNLVNLVTGNITNLVPPKDFLKRLAVGVNFYDAPDGSMVVIVAGAGRTVLPEVHLFNASSGNLMVSCTSYGNSTDGFMNDITIVGDTAYITNSLDNSIMTVNLTATLATGICGIGTITLPESWFKDGNNTVSNGIVGYDNKYLIIATTTSGALYSYDLTNPRISPLLNLGQIPGADGLTLVTNPPGSTTKATLYVTENAKNRISVWSVRDGPTSPIVESLGRTITSPSYDFPTTSGVLGDIIYTVNARFASLPFPANGEDNPSTFSTRFQLIGVSSSANGSVAATAAPSLSAPPIAAPGAAPTASNTSTNMTMGTMKPTSRPTSTAFHNNVMTMQSIFLRIIGSSFLVMVTTYLL